jgi:hypothetical protein
MEGRQSLAHIDNAASRVATAFIDACDRRDAARIRSLVSAAYESQNRRRNVRAGIDVPAGTISFLEESGPHPPLPIVATRGDRLALVRTTFRESDDRSECLIVFESDDSGHLCASVTFDLGDFDLAMAELDVRFNAGEASAHAEVWNALRRARQAIRRQDWDTLIEFTSDDAPIHDHRPLRSRPVYAVRDSIEDFRAIYAMSPEAKVLVRHVLGLCARGCLMIGEWRGAMDGGVFELLTATVVEVGPDGKVVRTDHHDLDQIDEARERYARLL